MKETSVITVHLPPKLRERMRVLAKQFRKTTSDVVRDALIERMEYLEDKLQSQERFTRFGHEKRKSKTIPDTSEKDILEVDENSLAPPALKNSTILTTNTYIDEDRFADVYTKHVPRILEASGNPVERRLRVAEAIAEIKRRAPMTSPSELELTKKIEEAVTAQKNKSPTNGINGINGVGVDDVIRKLVQIISHFYNQKPLDTTLEIDTNHIQTHGDVTE